MLQIKNNNLSSKKVSFQNVKKINNSSEKEANFENDKK